MIILIGVGEVAGGSYRQKSPQKNSMRLHMVSNFLPWPRSFFLFFHVFCVSFVAPAYCMMQMDATTAELIDATVFNAFRNSTIVAVAHRLSSVIKHCDSVAVMSEGKITERGSSRLAVGACCRTNEQPNVGSYFTLGLPLLIGYPRRHRIS